MSKMIVAIDGPAGSGKSTTAKLIAQKLNFLYIDSGAMYRAVTYLAIKNNVLDNTDALIELVKNTNIELKFIGGNTKVFLNNINVTNEIRSFEVNQKVSSISKIEEIRKILVGKQKEFGSGETGIVMEGRDIGTIVFPNADVKIFLTASINERALRRVNEYKNSGIEVPFNEIKENLEKRDILDSSRKISPLQKAPDAVEVDTSKVSIDEQVNIILNEIKKTARKKGVTLNI